MKLNIILALTGGGTCLGEGWIGSVPAMLHAWYMGGNGAQAVAEILMGQQTLPEGSRAAFSNLKYFHQ